MRTEEYILWRELNECRSLLAELVATSPRDAPNWQSIKHAADWLANWDGKRLYGGDEE